MAKKSSDLNQNYTDEKSHKMPFMPRRELLTRASQILLGSAGSLGLTQSFSSCTKNTVLPSGGGSQPGSDLSLNQKMRKKFLFVFGAMGGASINDSFLAIRESESKNASKLNVYPDSLVSQMDVSSGEFALRAIDLKMPTVGPLPFDIDTTQSQFLAKYGKEILVMTLTGNTVAHPVGQSRCVNGFEAWNGRTLQEAVAAYYGQDLLIPNVNMGTLGFAENGRDSNLPRFARAEQVSNAALFPFGLDGSLGIQGTPKKSLLNIARRVRDERLDVISPFAQTFHKNALIKEWMERRKQVVEYERRNLINLLNPYAENERFPFKDFGFEPNPRGEMFRKLFKNVGPPGPETDDLQNQALLAYLLVTSGLTCAVTFGLGMNVAVDITVPSKKKLWNTPTGFDYSHNAHRGTQGLLWQRTLDIIDRLITLLRATELAPGETYWDHSLIYIATEFGRDKYRESGVSEFTTGHHTNNAMVVISPLVNGGRLLGGIDPDTLLTYGFDPETGIPDRNRHMEYKHIYAGILQAMGVETPGSNLPLMKAMLKKS